MTETLFGHGTTAIEGRAALHSTGGKKPIIAAALTHRSIPCDVFLMSVCASAANVEAMEGVPE